MARNNNQKAISDFNKIVVGTKIKGEIISDGDLRIDGEVEGNISVKGKIVLGVSGKIQGEIICKNAEIQGKVDAQIKVEELLSLKESAKVEGNVITRKIAIEPGAILSGSIDMNHSNKADKKSIPDVKIKKDAS